MYLHNIGVIYRKLKDKTKAWDYYTRAKDINEGTFGVYSPEVAMNYNGLGMVLKESKELDDAESMHLKALSIFENSYGHNHEKVALTLNYLAEVHRKQGKYGYDGAEQIYDRALRINRACFGNGDHPEIAENLNGLAQVYKNQQNYNKSEPLFKEAIEMSIKTLGEVHPHVLNRYRNLADLYERWGKVADAQVVWAKHEEIKKKYQQSINN